MIMEGLTITEDVMIMEATLLMHMERLVANTQLQFLLMVAVVYFSVSHMSRFIKNGPCWIVFQHDECFRHVL